VPVRVGPYAMRVRCLPYFDIIHLRGNTCSLIVVRYQMDHVPVVVNQRG